jgi:pyruvate dehydrogenase E1 component beta subunit
VFLEPKRIYRAVSEPVADDGAPLPLDRCFILREGSHVTLISWGAMIADTLAAADALAEEGIDCEVIDVATLNPLDAETILGSVRKTGRAVIVQEAARHAGYGAEIAAVLADQALLQLLAPVRRVAGYDTVMPLPRLEKHYMPDRGRVAAAVRELMEYR